ncbi:hypothetical protein D623_10023724 [Myotis brandtii]|uniref:Uncharacterized protein n=1 Tax=Myotis brandtii TaxID=109478 RepID=S7NHU6_MYOBR|nr:hypothetical protein D623_10023724 [Myotis brandtii]
MPCLMGCARSTPPTSSQPSAPGSTGRFQLVTRLELFNTRRGWFSPAKPALVKPDPWSTTTAMRPSEGGRTRRLPDTDATFWAQLRSQRRFCPHRPR